MIGIILSIGDELVLGQTVDTNSAWLSQQLAAVGCAVGRHLTVSDNQADIERAIRESTPNCDVLLISGGIGPTEDDLTRQALAAVLDQRLEPSATWLAELERFFAARGRPMPAINRIQAMIPGGATMIFNHAGTAAGIHAVVGGQGSGFRVQGSGEVVASNGPQGDTGVPPELDASEVSEPEFTPPPHSPHGRDARVTTSGPAFVSSVGSSPPLNPEPRTLNPPHPCHVFVMPGVPKEMKAMFARDVLPFVRERSAGAVILSRTLHMFGLGESAVGERLCALMHRDRNPSVGTTVSAGVVSLRINARFSSLENAKQELDHTTEACRSALGDLIYGQDADTLPDVVAKLLNEHPVARRWAPAVCTAESCTGGLLAKMLTDVPGSSAYFRQGWVTYQNEAKMNELNVAAETLERHGAVSEATVREMASGAVARSGVPFAMAISGIAGPGGGTPDKPVGTVWIALAAESNVAARHFLFPGDREMIRDRAAKTALTMLRFHLIGKPLPF
jgi:competence/damage-inducible protein CinA-like protein/molybdenum cofactor synthesis domain-containing protein